MRPISTARTLGAVAAALAVGACGPRSSGLGPPPIPPRAGPPAIEVVYPREGSLIATRDSNFIFGSVGNGGVQLSINGRPVSVEPNGAFLAWLPVPAATGDTLATYELLATLGGATLREVRTVRLPSEPEPLPSAHAAVDSLSLSPRGAWWVREGERVGVRVRATPGASVRLLLPDGDTLLLDETISAAAASEAEWAFGAEPGPVASADGSGVYAGEFLARAPIGLGRRSPELLPVPADITSFARLCRPAPSPPQPDTLAAADRDLTLESREEARDAIAPDTSAIVAPPPAVTDSARADSTIVDDSIAALGAAAAPEPCAIVEVALAADTARARLPLDLWLLAEPGPVVRLREEPSEDVGDDGFIVGRAAPRGTTLWMWSEGVTARVSGRRDDALRIALDAVTEAWVSAEEAIWKPAATRPARTRVGTVRIAGAADRLTVDISLADPVPYQVDVDDRDLALTLYGAYAATDWLRYGAADDFLVSARWEQVSGDRYVLHLRHASQPWGYRVRQRPGALRLEVRKPPRIDRGDPLSGRRIVVDPGHPPAGSTGPTGLYEGDANLAIARRLAELLEGEGAEVVMTRTGRDPVRLYDRTRMAERANAELLVSIHNNALPDGVNPFESHGTSVFYFHPFSLDLAASLQRELLSTLGLRDLGVGRASLALVRTTWMPAALTEGAFMMIPAQEAALRDPRFQDAYARGVLQGIRSFLAERAR